MFVTLFNLQGAHRSSRRVFIIALGFSFVKSFFKFFQTFLSSFIRRSSGAIACRSHKRPAYFTTARFACQELFSSFSKLFEVLSAETLPCCAPLLRAAQLGYHTRFRLSSTFFELFQTLLCRPVSVGPLVGALAYTTRTFLLCQHLFSSFFGLFCTFFSTTISAPLRRRFTTRCVPPSVPFAKGFSREATPQAVPKPESGCRQAQ